MNDSQRVGVCQGSQDCQPRMTDVTVIARPYRSITEETRTMRRAAASPLLRHASLTPAVCAHFFLPCLRRFSMLFTTLFRLHVSLKIVQNTCLSYRRAYRCKNQRICKYTNMHRNKIIRYMAHRS